MQNPRFVLVLITVLFATPLLLAVLMRTAWWDFRPSELSNRGTLIQPPVALIREELGALSGRQDATESPHWLILLLYDGRCAEACAGVLADLRQVHIASGKHREKIRLWLVSPSVPAQEDSERIHGIYPEFELFVDKHGTLIDSLTQVERQSPLSTTAHQAFVVDPAANIILGYDPGFDPGDLAEDLDRLLTWSTQD